MSNIKSRLLRLFFIVVQQLLLRVCHRRSGLQGTLIRKGVVNQDQFVVLEGVGKTVLVFDCIVVGRRENGVDGYFHHVLQHGRDHPGQHASLDSDTGVGVGLDEERVQFVIEHEIQSKYLEAILPAIGVELGGNRMYQICGDVFHSSDSIIPFVFGLILYIFLEILVRHLIEVLKLAILLPLLLDGIVGQVHVLVLEVFEGVFFAGGAHVALFVPVPLDDAVDSCYQDVTADVELPLVVEERRLHILLNYNAAPTHAFLLHHRPNFRQIVGN